jgi:hypothetical protein
MLLQQGLADGRLATWRNILLIREDNPGWLP